MQISKYILHPFLLMLSGGVILWFVWARIPTSEEVQQAAPAQHSLKKNLPDPNSLSLISDFTAAGEVILESPAATFKINDARFQNLEPDTHAKLRDFFKGKRLSLKTKTEDNLLNLPIELYDPLCLKPEPNANVRCPLILEK